MSARRILYGGIWVIASTSMMGVWSGAFAAISLTPVPNIQIITVGGLSAIDIRIAGLGVAESPSVGTYDIDVTFDPTVLSFGAATFGDPALGNQLDLFGLGSISSATPSVGKLNLFELSLDPAADLNELQAGDFSLATIQFSGISPGTSTLGITIISLGDANGSPLIASVFSSSVVVTVIPAPATYVQLFSGLAMLTAVTRKRNSLMKI